MLDARGRFVTACGNSAVIDKVLLGPTGLLSQAKQFAIKVGSIACWQVA